jgi:hypothetical protein
LAELPLSTVNKNVPFNELAGKDATSSSSVPLSTRISVVSQNTAALRPPKLRPLNVTVLLARSAAALVMTSCFGPPCAEAAEAVSSSAVPTANVRILIPMTPSRLVTGRFEQGEGQPGHIW